MKMQVNPRVSTALVLIPLVLGVTVYGTHGLFAGLCAVAVLAGIWEWTGLAGPRQRRWKAGVLIIAALLLTVCYCNINSVMTLFIVGFSLAWWVVALILILRRQGGKKFQPPTGITNGHRYHCIGSCLGIPGCTAC